VGKKYSPATAVAARPGMPVFQPRVVDAAMKYIKHRRTVIQAGAHLGTWAKRLAEDFYSVFAWEPVPENWNICNVEVDLPNVTIFFGALGDERCTTGVNDVQYKRFSGSQKITLAPGHIPTPMYQVDKLSFIENLDAMFLDVEGFELNILRGASETIMRDRPVLVLESNGRYEQKDFDALMKKLRYEVVDRYDRDVILVPV